MSDHDHASLSRRAQSVLARSEGCEVSDVEKPAIANRAESCVPPVAVQVFVEDADRTPFFPIEIPSGLGKPYCTAAGTYKTRGNARTLPLFPSRLLALFMASGSQEFIERLQAATEELERSLAETKAGLMAEINGLLDNLTGSELSRGSAWSWRPGPCFRSTGSWKDTASRSLRVREVLGLSCREH